MKWLSRYWNIFSVTVLALSAGWIAWTAVSAPTSTGGRTPAPRPGFLAPDFELKTDQGKAVRLSDLTGKVVLVNVWASWCPPCRAEMPDLERIHKQYSPAGLVILGVNAAYQDNLTAMQDFLSQNGVTFPILLDMDGGVARKYQVQALPSSYFIGRDGVIRQVMIGGPMPAAFVQAQVESLLKEKP